MLVEKPPPDLPGGGFLNPSGRFGDAIFLSAGILFLP